MPNPNPTLSPHPDDDTPRLTPWQLAELWIQSDAAQDPKRARELDIRLEAIRTQALIDIVRELNNLRDDLATLEANAPVIIADGLTLWMDASPAELVAFRSMFRTALTDLKQCLQDLHVTVREP